MRLPARTPTCPPPTPTSPATATARGARRTTRWTSTTTWPATGCAARPSSTRSPRRTSPGWSSTWPGSTSRKVTVDGQPPAKYAARSNRLVRHAPGAGRPRHVVPRGRQVRRRPQAADRQAPRRRRLGGAGRRRDRGRPAARRADLVPVQRPARRQGVVLDHGHGRRRLHGGRQRRARRPEARLVDRHLALRAGRADGDLPGDRPDRPLRRARPYADAPVPMRAADPGRRRTRASRRRSAGSRR